MELEELKQNWEVLGEQDPMWAILSDPNMKGGKWNQEEFFATGVRDIQGVMDAAQGLGLEIARHAALDFGCGIGRMTQALCARFQTVVGTDVSESMIRRAGHLNRYPESCRYHLNAKPHLGDFEDGQFDFCMTFLVLQHMRPEYAKGYLKELCRVLRPKGVLLFQIPTLCRVPGVKAGEDAPRTPKRPATGIIEMYATAFHEVARTLAEEHMQIVTARSDGRAGAEFLSHEFWAIKD